MKRILGLLILIFTFSVSTSFGVTADLTADQEMIFTIDDDVGYAEVSVITVTNELETEFNWCGISADMHIDFKRFIIQPEVKNSYLNDYNSITIDKLEPPNDNNNTFKELIFYSYRVARDAL